MEGIMTVFNESNAENNNDREHLFKPQHRNNNPFSLSISALEGGSLQKDNQVNGITGASNMPYLGVNNTNAPTVNEEDEFLNDFIKQE
jgi:hypothetical protein